MTRRFVNVVRALGISAALLSSVPAMAQQGADRPFIGLQGDPNASEALIGGTVPGGTAEALGIQAGDVIIAVNGKATASHDDVKAAFSTIKPGDTVTISVRRGGKELPLTGKVLARPAQ